MRLSNGEILTSASLVLAFTFIAHTTFLFGLTTIILAYRLDSLVRVSRRDDKERLINVFSRKLSGPPGRLQGQITTRLRGYLVEPRLPPHPGRYPASIKRMRCKSEKIPRRSKAEQLTKTG